MKAFARFKNEIWGMILAYIDNIAKDNYGVKYLLVRQDLFDRTVDTKGRKTKDSKKTVRAFLTLITKKNHPKKIWVDKGTSLLESLKNYAKLKEYKFTPQLVRPRLHPHMEVNGYKYIHKLTEFVTTLYSRTNCLIDLIPKNVKNSDFSPFCTGNHYENLENPSLELEIEFACRSMTYPSGRVISHCLHKKFSKLLQFFQKTSKIHIKG